VDHGLLIFKASPSHSVKHTTTVALPGRVISPTQRLLTAGNTKQKQPDPQRDSNP